MGSARQRLVDDGDLAPRWQLGLELELGHSSILDASPVSTYLSRL